MRRTVWDGQQELYEIQMPLGFGQDPENDVAVVDIAPPAETNGSGYSYDVNPHFGRVLYTHALGIDQPPSIIRMGYVSRISTTNVVVATGVQFAAFAIVPFWENGGQRHRCAREAGSRSRYRVTPATSSRSIR